MAEALPSTGTKPHSVSYSETSTYLLCKRKWEYGYGRSLKRVTESDSLMLGSAVHKILETFYRRILEAGDTVKEQKSALPQAYETAVEQYELELANGFKDADNKASLHEIVFEFYLPNEPFVRNGWRVLAVEKDFALTTSDEGSEPIMTPFVIDLIALDPDGKTVVIDHKCIYDFYSYEDASLQPQIPLYIGGLRGLGYKVDYGYYNMLRNRKIGGTKLGKAELVEALVSHYGQDEPPEAMAAFEVDLPKMKVGELEELAKVQGIKTSTGATLEQRWSYLELKPEPRRVQRTFMEQLDTAQEIVALGMLTEEERDLKMHRVANKMVCQSCSFKDLCTTELNGGNVKLMIRTEYVKRERRVFEESEEAA
jgi:hypothetical protein